MVERLLCVTVLSLHITSHVQVRLVTRYYYMFKGLDWSICVMLRPFANN